MIDKRKMIDFLNKEIESCRIVGNESDKSIAWECQRIIERINAGLFDNEELRIDYYRMNVGQYAKTKEIPIESASLLINRHLADLCEYEGEKKWEGKKRNEKL